MFGWGGDGSGRLPATTTEYCSTLKADTAAVEVDTQHELISVAAGYGSVWASLQRTVLQCGARSPRVSVVVARLALAAPQLLSDIEDAGSVAAGEFLFGAIDAAGTIHTWGLNHEGALGRPTKQLNAMPGPVTSLPPASMVALGRGYMLALTRDGQLYAWGSNAAGQLGLGHLSSVATPQPLPLNVVIRSVAAGATHALAVTTKGEVLAWGSNHHGQLAQGSLPTRRSLCRSNCPNASRRSSPACTFRLRSAKAEKSMRGAGTVRGNLA